MAATTRSNRLIGLGAAVLVVGMGLATVALRAADAAPTTAPAAAEQAGAVVASDAAPSTTGTQAEPQAERFDIPEGMEAVAIQVTHDAGVGAVPVPGDHVNVYGVFTRATPGAAADAASGPEGVAPEVHRVLERVEVLDVKGTTAAVTGGSPTFVLAVSGEDAARVIFTHNLEKVWLTLVESDAPPTPAAAVDHGSVLR
jgi:Flp pilus assembly protein CpaB